MLFSLFIDSGCNAENQTWIQDVCFVFLPYIASRCNMQTQVICSMFCLPRMFALNVCFKCLLHGVSQHAEDWKDVYKSSCYLFNPKPAQQTSSIRVTYCFSFHSNSTWFVFGVFDCQIDLTYSFGVVPPLRYSHSLRLLSLAYAFFAAYTICAFIALSAESFANNWALSVLFSMLKDTLLFTYRCFDLLLSTKLRNQIWLVWCMNTKLLSPQLSTGKFNK